MKKARIKSALVGARKALTKKRLAIIGGVSAALLLIIPVVTYANYSRDIADRERLMNRNSTGIILRDKSGEIFYEYGRLSRTDEAKLSSVSDTFEKAIIASEDQDFYKHEGYSTRGIASAAYANLLNKDPTLYGGSTITQQLVKNKLLTTNKDFLRKYQELAMAIAIERRYSKEEILEMYINSVYFGEGAFGITDAAKIYFNKEPKDLDLAESSMLVGLLPAPAAYSPVSGDKDKAKSQQERVLKKMAETGVLEGNQDEALKKELSYSPGATSKQTHGQHFAMMVLDDLKDKYGEETVIRSGYDVTTSLDLNWQKEAEANVTERVNALSKAGARNASLVAIDPKTGQIRALVGSADWNNPTFGKVNMSTTARQPGSSFKPIYYAEALDKRHITLATMMQDQPKTYGGTYKPTNYDFKYRGNISIRNSLAQSLNIPSVDVMQKLGVEDAATASQRMGISTVNEPDKYGLSLALGTAEVKLNELTHAYAGIANNGQQHSLASVISIKDKYDEKVLENKQSAPKKVLSHEASYLMSSVLSDNQARAPTFGNNLTISGRKVAVKTGTTNDSKDAWTVGYTPQVVIGAWMGNNENEPMQGLAGSSSAGGLWRSTMTSYLKNLPNEDFQKPDTIVSSRGCGGLKEEFFIKGTEGECNQVKQNDTPKQEDKKPEDEEPEKPREELKPKKEEPKPLTPDTGGATDPNDEEEGGRGGGVEPIPPEPEPTGG